MPNDVSSGRQQVERIETGIAGLDRVLGGGAPKERCLLVSGESGTGKTVLLCAFLYHGITSFGEAGVFVTCEETAADLRRNLTGFGWDFAALEAAAQLAIIDVSPTPDELVMMEVNERYDLKPLLEIITAAVQRINAKRVAIDNLSNLFMRYRSEIAVRRLFHQLVTRLRELGVTTFLSAERHGGQSVLSEHGVEEFVADGFLELTKTPGELRTVRRLLIHKLRGLAFETGEVEFVIGAEGVEAFPRIPLERRVADVQLGTRRPFGIPKFDAMLHGGLPEGHLALISGSTGSGKSTFGLQFVHAGVESGEACIYVTIEESSDQLLRIAQNYGWNWTAAQQQKRPLFIDVPFSDIRPDQVLYQIVNAAHRLKAKRLVVDSISALLSAGLTPREHRLFLEQLASFCKTQGITVLLLYAVGGVLGAAGAVATITEARLSSTVDAIILLQSVEEQSRFKRLVNIVKVRGTAHELDLYHYSVTEHGIEIGERYVEGGVESP